MRWQMTGGILAGVVGLVVVHLGDARVQPAAAQTTPAQERAPQPKASPLACYQIADDRTTLSRDQAMRLCAGAANAVPVDCFLEADRRLMVSDDYNITLCQCAPSLAPVDCFTQSQGETDISEQRSLQMCNARTLFNLGADCRPI